MTARPAGVESGAHEAASGRAGVRRRVVVYTALRVAVFLVVFGALWALRLGVYPALLIAALVSGALSYVLLRRQREALAQTVEQRLATGRRHRASREAMPTPQEVARVTGRASPGRSDQDAPPPPGG